MMKFKLLETLFLIFFIISCCNVYCEREQYANIIICRADNYIKLNGTIPNDLSELGLEEKENILAYFNKISEDKYVVLYGSSL